MSLITTIDDIRYEVVMSRDPTPGSVVSVEIYVDGVCAGKGRLDAHAQIVDCPADLGDDVYDALDTALADHFAAGNDSECDPTEAVED